MVGYTVGMVGCMAAGVGCRMCSSSGVAGEFEVLTSFS